MPVNLPIGYVNFNSPVKYYIDGLNLFSTYGIVVENSRGIISAPAVKKPFSYNWPDRHGEVVDSSTVLFEPKEFTLDCWILGISNIDIATKINNIFFELSKPGLRRVMVFVDNNKPLIYQCLLVGNIEVTKKWTSADSLIHAEFSVTFREPEPLKMILAGNAADGIMFDISFTCTKPVNLRWGKTVLGSDMVEGGSPDSLDIVGERLSFTQSYVVDQAKIYPILTGALETITDFSITGLTTLWARLL